MVSRDPLPNTSEETTRGIHVSVKAQYVPERSNPAEGEWFFAYTIRIANEGPIAAQLLSRHWIITDADGKVEEVRGPGVVGRQPLLGPGEAFEYTSACPLGTSFGVMEGTYSMVTPAGDQFDVRIAPFSLSEPFAIN
jgi:ApaG protein